MGREYRGWLEFSPFPDQTKKYILRVLILECVHVWLIALSLTSLIKIEYETNCFHKKYGM